MNNNTRGFVALLFLEVLVPTSPPIYQHTHPTISTNLHPPDSALSSEARGSEIAEPRSGGAT